MGEVINSVHFSHVEHQFFFLDSLKEKFLSINIKITQYVLLLYKAAAIQYGFVTP